MDQQPLDQFSADILIVDDMLNNLRVLSSMLTNHGYKVRKATNGDRAIQAVQAVRPDLILLDINMPEMDGYEVCRQLKQSDSTRSIPIIFISALGEVDDKVKAFEAGGVDYITKPFQLPEILVRVENHLRICDLQRQLQQQNQTLHQEVQDRITAQQALKRLNDDLEQRVQSRTAELATANEELRTLEARLRQQLNVFLHAVSHDLRNPVLGTSMVLQNLVAQAGDGIEVPKTILQRMIEGNERQLHLINSLIDTHAAEVLGIILKRQTIHLPDLVRSALNDLQPLMDKENVSYDVEISSDLIAIEADPLQLARVYQNLIANALRHNPPGIHLTIQAEQQEDSIDCRVIDNGVGIQPDHLNQLFDLYFQGNQKRRSVGLGLGLYLCQQIIQAHGGTIWVESQVGEGTTFHFKLPVGSMSLT